MQSLHSYGVKTVCHFIAVLLYMYAAIHACRNSTCMSAMHTAVDIYLDTL